MTALSDDFNRANGGLGSDWTVVSGSVTISSNAALFGGSDSVAQHVTQMETDDQYAEAVCGGTGTLQSQVLVRGSSTNTYYMGRYEGAVTDWEIYKRINGTWTLLASVDAGTQAPPYTVRLEVEGSTLRLYGNGVLRVTVEDTSITTGKIVGMRSNMSGNTLDDFAAGDLNPPPPPPPTVVEPTVVRSDPHVLGVGVTKAFLFDRGGTRRIGALRGAQQIRWGRRRDDISTSTLVLDPNRCSDVLDKMHTGRHEIVIYRNDKRVWEGPITRVTEKATQVEVVAHDICHYSARTAMRAAYDNRYAEGASRITPVTNRARNIVMGELSRKEALGYNLLQHVRVIETELTAMTSRLSLPYEWSVWEELDHMAAKLGLDYTAIGRALILFGTYETIGRTRMLTDAHFGTALQITHYGMELATHSAVTDGEGRYAAVGANHPFYGEVELVHTVYGEGVEFKDPDNPTAEELEALSRELTSQATRNLAGRLPIPSVVRIPDNTTLSPNAPVTIEELIPGVQVPVRANSLRRPYQQVQKLDALDVTWTPAGEKVSVVLTPWPGSTPWDDTTETAGDEEG